MSIPLLTDFFMWTTILGFWLLMFSTAAFVIGKKSIYRIHRKWFDISPSNYDMLIFAYLAIFKVLLIIFSLIPYLTLLIIG
ncbi:DUF6868 family protein [Persicirhabdus sediminis]|uniref:DUF6868 domain-containing protein n=1 Tax=Persicirhabdus sediminis TaxID=454144 RepID=A0A8J7SJA0_9BACT|nr:hypothetical protein [Persicirhabdus sediminis]MBK1791204.1 hypothetical protein [Persicirhabdus sediminis]